MMFRAAIAAFSLGLLLAYAALGDSVGPDTNPSAGTDKFSEPDEIARGRQIGEAYNFLKPMLCRHNPTSQRVTSVLNALSKHTERPDLGYNVTVVNDPSDINAYAAPGGFIFVPTGMLEFLDTPDELALVLAHELGHISGRHHVRLLQDVERIENRAIYLQLLVRWAATIVGATVDASAHRAELDPRLGSFAEQLASYAGDAAASKHISLCLKTAVEGYGRQREEQADRLGMMYVKRQGAYSPAAALKVFRKFKALHQQFERRTASSPQNALSVNYLNAHPAIDTRIALAEQHLVRLGAGTNVVGTESSIVPEGPAHQNWPLNIGPTVLPVEPGLAWSALCRVAACGAFQNIESADAKARKMTVSIAGDRYFPATLSVIINRADPAGTEISIAVDASDHAVWPTVLLKQIRAELGIEYYRCLATVSPIEAGHCSCSFLIATNQAVVYSSLLCDLPWQLNAQNANAGYLLYNFFEALDLIGLKVIVLSESSTSCRIVLSQGAMASGQPRAVNRVTSLLEARGFKPTNNHNFMQ